jgi:hypothetical protein
MFLIRSIRQDRKEAYGNRSWNTRGFGVESPPSGDSHFRNFEAEKKPAQAAPDALEEPPPGALSGHY